MKGRHGAVRRTVGTALLALVMMAVAAIPARAQTGRFMDWERTVEKPYAGKNEARIGGSRESEHDKLRLDIGGSVDIWSFGSDAYVGDTSRHGLQREAWRTSFGADFFTWTRLRAAGGFKFPVEAVDYYFGINASRHYNQSVLADIRLRVAHISAHLVDGDPSFTNPSQQYITYSREFVDLMAGLDGMRILGLSGKGTEMDLRPYAGVTWLFHTIPDTLGRVTPYVGIDGYRVLSEGLLTLTYGYEARLNTELEPIGEHLVRVGLKVGEPRGNGVTVEGSYYAGRSMYGQHFSTREKFFSLGFAIDM